jgi:biopolymer transport protein TolR
MAMSLGGGHGRKPEINVTPMIDVLLVLIIIFMVIIPMNSVGLKAIIPQPSLESAPQAPSSDVVITVQGDRKVLLNQEPVPVADLGSRLKTLFAGLPAGKVIFIRADKDIEFERVAEVIDIAKGAGLDHFALMSQ